MSTSWLELRKDIFIRDIVRDCIGARLYFNSIKKTFSETGNLPYDHISEWVGTESKKGPLWRLKDQTHRLFRINHSCVNPYEHLFDWTIGSIFHEAMKLKEDTYQVSSYKPLLESKSNFYKENKELSKILKEYFALIENAHNNIGLEINNIDELFNRAIYHLRMILPSYSSNMLLLRYILDSRDVFESLLGKGSFQEILRSMFGDTGSKAYVVAAEYCIRNGWYKAAQQYLREVMRADPQYIRSRELMKEATAKLNASHKKEKTQ